MKLYYFDARPNFGDHINTWLWQRLLPGFWTEDDDVLFSGIGTIVSRSMPDADRWIIFSSGAGYGPPPGGFPGDGWDVVCVRGPLSASVLGLTADKAVADGALLLASLPEYRPLPEEQRSGIVFVPHHGVDHLADWSSICAAAGVEYLSPKRDSRDVVDRLRRARLVLADAMHAAIIADTMRVPWIPLATSGESNTFKWADFTRSMQVAYRPITVPPASGAIALRALTLRLTRRHYRQADADPQSLVDWYRREYLAGNGNKRIRRLGRRLSRKIERLFGHGIASSALAARDGRRAEQATAVLAAATQRSPSLSEDSVFLGRLNELNDRLDHLRRTIGERKNTETAPESRPVLS